MLPPTSRCILGWGVKIWPEQKDQAPRAGHSVAFCASRDGRDGPPVRGNIVFLQARAAIAGLWHRPLGATTAPPRARASAGSLAVGA